MLFVVSQKYRLPVKRCLAFLQKELPACTDIAPTSKPARQICEHHESSTYYKRGGGPGYLMFARPSFGVPPHRGHCGNTESAGRQPLSDLSYIFLSSSPSSRSRESGTTRRNTSPNVPRGANLTWHGVPESERVLSIQLISPYQLRCFQEEEESPPPRCYREDTSNSPRCSREDTWNSSRKKTMTLVVCAPVP